MSNSGLVFGTMSKLPNHILECPIWIPPAPLLIQQIGDSRPGRHQLMALTPGSLSHLPPTWETQTEFLGCGFSPAKSWLVWAFEEQISKRRNSFYPYLCLLLSFPPSPIPFKHNELKKKKKKRSKLQMISSVAKNPDNTLSFFGGGDAEQSSYLKRSHNLL